MEQTNHAGNALFVLLGAIMVLAMHAGFAFLELGTSKPTPIASKPGPRLALLAGTDTETEIPGRHDNGATPSVNRPAPEPRPR